MSTTYYDRSKRRWRVRWFRTDGTRAQRQFPSRPEAEAFAASVSDERPARRPGPKAAPFNLDSIRRRTLTEDGCWIWQPRGGSNGYAQLSRRINGRSVTRSVHRLAYELVNGAISAGMHLDHLCARPRCVNPDHLDVVTATENNRRRDARKAAA